MEKSSNHTTSFDWLFVMLGGLPFFLPAILFLGETELGKNNPVYWYYWVNALISAPHVNSTYWRLTRKIHNDKVAFFFGFPAYLLCAGILILASQRGYLLQALTFINVVQSFHYVRQTYGVYRFYTRRPNQPQSEHRLSYFAFHSAMPLFVFGRWDTLFTVWKGKPSDAIIPMHFPSWFIDGCWALAICGLVVGCVLELRKYFKHKQEFPFTGLTILFTYFAIHAYGFLSVSHYQRGFMAVTIFHAVQYLALVWKTEKPEMRPSLAETNFYFLGFWALIFAAGFGVERLVLPPLTSIWPLFATIALAAVSAHHYWADAVIWKAKVGR